LSFVFCELRIAIAAKMPMDDDDDQKLDQREALLVSVPLLLLEK